MNDTFLAVWALLSTVYAVLATGMWHIKASDCYDTDTVNKNLHDMLNRQFDASRKLRPAKGR